MSRLINYGPGEICDRLSILALKILHHPADADHWKKERAVLLTQLRGRLESANWYEHAVELGAVNSAIWHAEDDLRLLRAGWMEAEQAAKFYLEQEEEKERKPAALYGMTLGFRLQLLNDQRAGLIAKINELAGEKGGPEKVNG